MIRAIKSFFSSSRLLREVNATILALVPKKVNPSSMGDVIYKSITKILANRMIS